MAARANAAAAGRNVSSEIAYLARALKAPSLAGAVERLAERARAESWTHEEFLAACLQREVAARESHGGEGRIRAARFPARKSLEDFDFDHQRSLKREVITHLGTLWASGPARPGTGSRSRPPPSGSPGSPTPTTPAASRTSSPAWAASPC
jgi:hypothetical protein